MKNNFIQLNLNDRNEIRADVNLSIKNLNIMGIERINVKIDTGCPYTSIPIKKLGISEEMALRMKLNDCRNDKIKKDISFGVNDTKDKIQETKRLFRAGFYQDLKSVTFNHTGLEIDFQGFVVHKDEVKVSYDRTGNILIGMDILKDWDIHMGTVTTGETIFLACPKEWLNNEYFEQLDKLFGIERSDSGRGRKK